MTNEELDAIKARCEAYDDSEKGVIASAVADMDMEANAPRDLRALVAEVERLRGLLVRSQPYLKKCGDDYDKSKSRLEAEIRTALEGK